MIALQVLTQLLPLLALFASTWAATAADWRSRSIYQLLTDRFALPNGNNGACDELYGRYCGGNWRGIINKLDYIQGMGFDAIWISPVNENIEGSFRWGQPYHGYHGVNWRNLNSHFGTPSDLKDLSNALHSRGMYLMIDVAVNHAASTTTDISNASLERAAGGRLQFKKREHYHPACRINYGSGQNDDNLQKCWFTIGEEGKNDISLMDLATETPAVANELNDWIRGFVKEYGIDGIRMDASKHMDLNFQNNFCQAAGVYCAGEVIGEAAWYTAQWQGPQGMDAVLGYSMWYGLTRTLGGKADRSMTYLRDMVDAHSQYKDATVIPNFLDNHDQSRFLATGAGDAQARNAIVANHLIAGIPTTYYGTEQEIKEGVEDPFNRNALWKHNGYSTSTGYYQLYAKLNRIRRALGSGTQFHNTVGRTVAVTDNDIAIQRNNVLIVLTKRGNGGSGTWRVGSTPFAANSQVYDLLTCNTARVGSDGSLTVNLNGGKPFVYASYDRAKWSGLC